MTSRREPGDLQQRTRAVFVGLVRKDVERGTARPVSQWNLVGERVLCFGVQLVGMGVYNGEV